MGCTKCGTDLVGIKLVVKDLIRQMIDEGKLQEGLLDCADSRLWRDARVLTCDMLSDAVCQLITDGEICLKEPTALTFDKETGALSLIMSDGSVIDTTLSISEDTKVDDVAFDKTTKTITITNSDGSEHSVVLNGILSDTNIGAGLEFVANKLNVKVDGTTIKVVDGVLQAQLPAPFDDADIKRRLSALEAKGDENTTYTAGDGVSMVGTTISAKIDSDTIKVNERGELHIDTIEVTNAFGNVPLFRAIKAED